MSNLSDAVKLLNEPDKSVFESLIEFYDNMKRLESDPDRGGKQAVTVVMTVNDLTAIYKKYSC